MWFSASNCTFLCRSKFALLSHKKSVLGSLWRKLMWRTKICRITKVIYRLAAKRKGNGESTWVFQFLRNLEVIPSVRFCDALGPYNLTESTDSLWSPHIQHTLKCCSGPIVQTEFLDWQEQRIMQATLRKWITIKMPVIWLLDQRNFWEPGQARDLFVSSALSAFTVSLWWCLCPLCPAQFSS